MTFRPNSRLIRPMSVVGNVWLRPHHTIFPYRVEQIAFQVRTR